MDPFDNLIFLLGCFVIALAVLFVTIWAALRLARILVDLSFVYFPVEHERGLEDDSGRFLVIPLKEVTSRVGRRALATLTYQLRNAGIYERKPTVNFRGPKGEFIAKKCHVAK